MLVYIFWLKQFKPYVPTVIGNIVVTDALRRALLHCMCGLKATRMQCSLIQELQPCKFELDQSTTKATKNICCAKDVVDYRNSNQMVKEILPRLQEPWQSGKVKKV